MEPHPARDLPQASSVAQEAPSGHVAVAARSDLPVAKGLAAPPPPGATQISAATATDANAASVPEAVALHASQSLTVLSLEAHVSTAGFLMPNPGRRPTEELHAEAGDEVRFVWYAVKEDRPTDGVAPQPAVAKSGAAGGGAAGGEAAGGGRRAAGGRRQATRLRPRRRAAMQAPRLLRSAPWVDYP